MNRLNKTDKTKAEKFGLTAEIESILNNCELQTPKRAELRDLEKMRKWEQMELVGNYLDPNGEIVEDWHEIKRVATFCRKFDLTESKFYDLQVLAICEEAETVAYGLSNSRFILEIVEFAENEEAPSPEVVATGDPLETALIVSKSRPSSQYNPTSADIKNGFYFEYNGEAVPFSAVIQENEKVKGIASVSFGTARDCPSRSLGLCQLPNDSLCYARAGEKRATRKNNGEGLQGMDSIFNGLLCSVFWDKFESDSAVRLAFMEFLDSKDIKTLRFNLKGDFRHCLDCLAIFHLAGYGYKLTGYTARDDLAECEELGRHENIILNGSNRKYTNRFRATDSIAEYLEAKYRCIGNCSKCRKCYTLRGVEIIVLVHGNGSQTQLNNSANWELLNETLGVFHGVKFDTQDTKRAKGLLTCINKALALRDLPTFADFEALKQFLGEYLENWG